MHHRIKAAPGYLTDAEGDHDPQSWCVDQLMEQDVPQDINNQISFEILVHVDLPSDKLQLLLQVADDGAATALHSSSLHATAAGSSSSSSTCSDLDDGDVTFADTGRGDAGDSYPVGAPISWLPPLAVQLSFPPDYPSRSPPDYVLQASWLTYSQLCSLCRHLNDLWQQEGVSSPVCFTWLDWLKCSALAMVGITDTLTLSETHDRTAMAAGVSAVTPDQLAVQLLRYNAAQEYDNFCAATWRCSICFEDVLGSRCLQLPECRHHYCKTCLEAYCESQVSEGAVESLRCPEPSCKRPLPPYVVRQLLGPTEYAR